MVSFSLSTFNIHPDPHWIGNMTTIDNCATTGNGDCCGTELLVMDSDYKTADSANSTGNPGSIVVGGFTQNKTLVWMSPAEHFWPPKETPADDTKLPRGCYSDTQYSCGDSTVSTPENGVAFIYKAGSFTSAYGDVPVIRWQKFFESYSRVTAVALSRHWQSYETQMGMENRQENSAGNPDPADGSAWTFDHWRYDPQESPIYDVYVAAFLKSRCLNDHSHKIVTLDYQTGEVLQAYPYISRQEVFQEQFLFQYTGGQAQSTDSDSIYKYSIYTLSNVSSANVNQFMVYKYDPVQKYTSSDCTGGTACETINPGGSSIGSFHFINVEEYNPGTTYGVRNHWNQYETLEDQITDSYTVQPTQLYTTSTHQYGPQSIVQMDGEIYVGGAIKTGSILCPTLAKLNAGLTDVRWAYSSINTCSSDTDSYAVDILYADFLNDKIFGLMVPRTNTGDLQARGYYRLLITNGNQDETTTSTVGHPTYAVDCSKRIFIMKITPPEESAAQSTTHYWRPLGMSLNQDFDTTSENSEFVQSKLHVFFRPLQSSESAKLATNELGSEQFSSQNIGLEEHILKDSISDKLFRCVANKHELDFPKKSAHDPSGVAGSATYWRRSYAKISIDNTPSDSPAELFINGMSLTSMNSQSMNYIANIQTSSGGNTYKVGAIFNADSADVYYPLTEITEHIGIEQVDFNRDGAGVETTPFAIIDDHTANVIYGAQWTDQNKYECTSSLSYSIDSGGVQYCGDTSTSNAFLQDRTSGDLFNGQFWDDHTFELQQTASSQTVTYAQYMSQHDQYSSYVGVTQNEDDGCDRTECTIMQYSFETGDCYTNYTDALYLHEDQYLITDSRKWLIRMQNYSDVDMWADDYTSWDGTIEINTYPMTEFRIWICVKCTNDFQNVTTLPFMVDVQCGAASTKIDLPWHLQDVNDYNNKTQTFEATIEQGTIFYEFLPFNISNSPCPIIQYRVKDVKVWLHNHDPGTLNYKYGRNYDNSSKTDYIYEKRCDPPNCDLSCGSYTAPDSSISSTVTGTGCNDRLEPKNDNNTVIFRAFNDLLSLSSSVVGTDSSQGGYQATAKAISNDKGFSPDDIAQYDDEDQTSLKRNNTMQTGYHIQYYDPNELTYTITHASGGLGKPLWFREHSIGNDQTSYYDTWDKSSWDQYNDTSWTANTGPSGSVSVTNRNADYYHSNQFRTTASPFRKDSQVLHVMDCTTFNNNNKTVDQTTYAIENMINSTGGLTQCSRPLQDLSEECDSATDATCKCEQDPGGPDDSNFVWHDNCRPERSWEPVYNQLPSGDLEINTFRLYVYETRIVQQISFTIEALAEGGRRLEAQKLILNITCPGHADVIHPDPTLHGVTYEDSVTKYIGGHGADAQYTFPAFYTTFEQCNFITGYTLAKDNWGDTNYNRTTIMGKQDISGIEAPHDLWLTDDLNTDRQPNVRQTIQFNTDCAREYEYYLLIEVQLTKTSWTEFIYTFADKNYLSDSDTEKYFIEVVQGTPNTAVINPDLAYNQSGSPFPSEDGETHYKIIMVDSYTTVEGFINYAFDYFWCDNINVATADGSGLTCNYYNISSSSTEIVPIINYNNSYSIDPPRQFYDTSDAANQRWRMDVVIPTDELRNASAGNQIEFYIFASYNNDAANTSMADGRFAAYSQKMVIDIACGNEIVDVYTSEYSYLFKEGTAEEFFGNETFEVNPDNLTLTTSKPYCPFVKFELFKDVDLTIPWTNTSHVMLHNEDDPYSGYIDVTTYEEDRYTWVRHIYLKATTLGGVSNTRAIHFKLTIVETFDDEEVDHAPIFSGPIIEPQVRVWERDLILKNTTTFYYWSPKAVDNEKDPIQIINKYDDYYPYLDLQILSNDSFHYSIDCSELNFLDEGQHYFKIILKDDDIRAKPNRKWQQIFFNIEYVDLDPKQYWNFNFTKLEMENLDFANITSIEIDCPDITWTNATAVKNLCKDIVNARFEPRIEFATKINSTYQAVDLLRDAEYVRFGVNFTTLMSSINNRTYKLTPEIVEETFGTSMICINMTVPVNYTCHIDPNCWENKTVIINKTLSEFNDYMLPNLNDSIEFMTEKLLITERPMFVDEEPAPDLRPPPEFLGFTIFSNSTMKVSFSEPIQFDIFSNVSKEVNEIQDIQNFIDMKSQIDDLLNENMFVWIESGSDGSRYLSNDLPEEDFEEIEEEEIDPVCQQFFLVHNMTCEQYDFQMEDLMDKRASISSENKEIIQEIISKAREEFVVQMVKLAYYMDIAELDRYITSLEPSLSAILYEQDAAIPDAGDDEAPSADDPQVRRLARTPVPLAKYPGLKEITREEVEDIKFRFKYSDTIENDIWIDLQFSNFENVNMASSKADVLEMQFQNLDFIVSIATLKPVVPVPYRYREDIPPLHPDDNEVYEKFLFNLKIIILVLQAVGFLQNLPFKKRSQQSLWSMINALALISHTSLFKINQTPGKVYRLFKYTMNFYMLPPLSNFSEYYLREPFNREFEDMGYFCSNFIPLLYLGTIIFASLMGLSFLSILFRIQAVRSYKKKCCRVIGIYLPDKYLFRRLFFKIFICTYLQILLSALLQLIAMDDLNSEFPVPECNPEKRADCKYIQNKDGDQRTILNGLSTILAMIALLIVIPIILHMMYIIQTYFAYLDDEDIKEKFGHYYMDLSTQSLMQAQFFIFYMVRRIAFVCIVLFIREDTAVQLIMHISLSSVFLVYLIRVKPFERADHNAQEIFNEMAVFILAVIQQGFQYMVIPSSYTSKLIPLNNMKLFFYNQVVFGNIYRVIVIAVLFVNLFYFIYSSYFQNYLLTVGYIYKVQKIKAMEKKLAGDIFFKERFTDENNHNFMITFEIERQRKLLDAYKEANKFFFDKYFKREDIKWMEYNNIPQEEIKKIYPDYVPKQQRNMYMPTTIPVKKPKQKKVAKKTPGIVMHPSITPISPNDKKKNSKKKVDKKPKKDMDFHDFQAQQDKMRLEKQKQDKKFLQLQDLPEPKIDVDRAVKNIKKYNKQAKKKVKAKNPKDVSLSEENLSAVNEQVSGENENITFGSNQYEIGNHHLNLDRTGQNLNLDRTGQNLRMEPYGHERENNIGTMPLTPINVYQNGPNDVEIGEGVEDWEEQLRIEKNRLNGDSSGELNNSRESQGIPGDKGLQRRSPVENPYGGSLQLPFNDVEYQKRSSAQNFAQDLDQVSLAKYGGKQKQKKSNQRQDQYYNANMNNNFL